MPDHLKLSFTSASLKQAVRRGARSVAISQVLSQLISLVVLASLYRLVSPEDYGLLGMALLLLTFLRNLTTAGSKCMTTGSWDSTGSAKR